MDILYVSDLDGTLLSTHSSVSQYSMGIINSLVSQGMLFTYATARSLVSASVVTKGLSTKIPVIAYNGAFIFDSSTGEIITSEFFKEEENDRVIEILRNHHINPLVYSFIQNEEKVSWITGSENHGVRNYLGKRKGDKRLRPLITKDGLYDGHIFYYTCIGEQEQLEPVYRIFSDDVRYTCTFQQELYHSEYWLEIMPKNATKANAIKKLKKLRHCHKVVSFGDAINDIPMFQISDECYAVENAVDALKQIATGVIGSNDADGVANWLKEHVNI